MDNTKKNVVEWFFGYGGNHIGLKQAGVDMRILALCEIEEYAIRNILTKMEEGRLPLAPIWSDCKTFPREPFKNCVDIFIASYPCQPFSSAGKRLGKEDPRHLWPYVYEFVRDVRPEQCFFENVEGHVTKGLQEVIEDLEGIGYKVSWGIFSAEECGAPHRRKRLFILAHTDSEGSQGFRGASELTVSEKREGTKRHATQSSGQFPSRPGEDQYDWEEARIIESSLGGATPGVAHRVDRLRLLGNGVVPQTAALAWKVLHS